MASDLAGDSRSCAAAILYILYIHYIYIAAGWRGGCSSGRSCWRVRRRPARRCSGTCLPPRRGTPARESPVRLALRPNLSPEFLSRD